MSTEEFNDIYVANWPALVNYASLLLGAESDAKDVVQNVFVSIWGQKAWAKPEEARPYLMRAVYNRCLDLFRAEKVRDNFKSWYAWQTRVELLSCFDPDKNDVIKKIYRSDTREEIWSAINSLPEKCREIFVLRYIEGFSAKKTSAMLGISTSTVNNQILKALKLLRKRLGLLGSISFFFFLIFR